MSKRGQKKATKKKVVVNKVEQRRAAKVAAMPEVTALIRKRGLSVVRACVTGISVQEKALRDLNRRKKEIEELERSIRTGRGARITR